MEYTTMEAAARRARRTLEAIVGCGALGVALSGGLVAIRTGELNPQYIANLALYALASGTATCWALIYGEERKYRKAREELKEETAEHC